MLLHMIFPPETGSPKMLKKRGEVRRKVSEAGGKNIAAKREKRDGVQNGEKTKETVGEEKRLWK